MSQNSKETNAFKMARAKSNATAKTLKLVISIHGKLTIVLATILTLLLVTTLHLNAPLAFAGSTFGVFLVLLLCTPLKEVWRSEFSMACQQEGLWGEATRVSSEGIEEAIQQILAGKYPQVQTPDLALKISQMQIIAIRKGEMKKAAKFVEFLCKQSDDDSGRSYQTGTLGCIYIDLGNYERGMQMLCQNLDELEAENRNDAPACVSALLGLLQGALDLERIEEAEKWLLRLKKAIDLSATSTGKDETDRWVKQDSNCKSIDKTFYAFYSAKLKLLKDDPEAELHLKEAFEFVQEPGVQQRVTLLYPEMLVFQANMMLKKSDFTKAEKIAKQAVEHYEVKTQNRGSDYIKAKRTLAYARLMDGSTDELGNLVECLKQLQAHLYELHPSIAISHIQIGEAFAKQGHWEKSREHWQESLKIRQRLCPEGSPGIREAEKLLAKLPEPKATEVAPG